MLKSVYGNDIKTVKLRFLSTCRVGASHDDIECILSMFGNNVEGYQKNRGRYGNKGVLQDHEELKGEWKMGVNKPENVVCITGE